MTTKKTKLLKRLTAWNFFSFYIGLIALLGGLLLLAFIAEANYHAPYSDIGVPDFGPAFGIIIISPVLIILWLVIWTVWRLHYMFKVKNSPRFRWINIFIIIHPYLLFLYPIMQLLVRMKN